MSETLLDIVQAAANEVLVTVPTSVVNSTDEIAAGMLGLANASGRDLVRRAEWGALMTLATIPTVANQSDYALPADFFRMVGDTSWDTSTNWSVGGPITPQMEQFLLDSTAGRANVYRQFRQIGRTKIRITPVPPDASGVVVFLYVSRNWCLGAGSVPAPSFAADTDTTVFDFDLMVKAVKWRWMAAKGQDAVELRAEYEDALSAVMAADQGGGTLNMGGPSLGLPGGQVVADMTPNFRVSTGSGSNILID